MMEELNGTKPRKALDHAAERKTREWLEQRRGFLIGRLVTPQLPDETERLRGAIREIDTILRWLDDDTVGKRAN